MKPLTELYFDDLASVSIQTGGTKSFFPVFPCRDGEKEFEGESKHTDIRRQHGNAADCKHNQSEEKKTSQIRHAYMQ